MLQMTVGRQSGFRNTFSNIESAFGQERVLCLPFNALMNALNEKVVDFLKLDYGVLTFIY